MSLTASEMSPADLVAITGNGRNDGFGYGEGGFLYWMMILFFFMIFGNGGWGGNFGGNGGMNGLYPWMNQSNQMNDGFRDQMLYGQINGIQNSITSGFGDVATALCGGFAGVNASVNNAQNAIVQQMWGNQIADMQQNFGMQTAMMQGFNGVTAQGADLKYTVATEACADRNAISQGIRDVMENCNRNYQGIMDKLCQLELDGVKGQYAQAQREILGLQNQVNMLNLAASQTAQTADLRQNNAQVANQLISELRSCPIPAQPVYGSQPIFTCGGNNTGCGCGALA